MVFRGDTSETELVNCCCCLLCIFMLFLLIVDANMSAYGDDAYRANVSDNQSAVTW